MAEAVPAVQDAIRRIAWRAKIAIEIEIEIVEVAQGVIENIRIAAAATLGALYRDYRLLRRIVDGVVRRCLGGERNDQEIGDIRPGSLHVLLRCLTEERFLEVLEDYESGRMKERLQKEFSQVGFKVEGLKVKIENMEEVNKTKETIVKKRYDVA